MLTAFIEFVFSILLENFFCSLCPNVDARQAEILVEDLEHMESVLAQIRAGNKIAAIKEYRRLTGSGLREAKETVEMWEKREKVGNVEVQTGATDELQRLILAGRKIEAIKYYRETTGAGLKEAKDAIDRMQVGESRGRNEILLTEKRPVDPDEVRSLLLAGRKIEAIRYYRAMTGAGLREAKDAIDKMDGEDSGQHEPPQVEKRLIDPDELQRLLLAGRKIEAIKYYREVTGVGLKEAKDSVDWMEKRLRQEGQL